MCRICNEARRCEMPERKDRCILKRLSGYD